MNLNISIFLLCLFQFVLAINEDKVKIGIVFHQEHQNSIAGQIEKRVMQSISNYQSVEIRIISMDNTYQIPELLQLMSDQGELDHLFIPCYKSNNQNVVDKYTFYSYDLKYSVESSYTFSLNNVNPK